MCGLAVYGSCSHYLLVLVRQVRTSTSTRNCTGACPSASTSTSVLTTTRVVLVIASTRDYDCHYYYDDDDDYYYLHQS